MGRDVRRLLLGLLIVAIPAAFVVLGVRGFVVRNAVVTARLQLAEAPIGGIVTRADLALGEPAGAATPVVALHDPRRDPQRLDSLAAEIERTLRSLETHQDAISWYDDSIAALQGELDALIEALKTDLQLAARVTEADIAAEQARLAYLTAEAERASRLLGSGESRAQVDAAEADRAESEARLARHRAQAERLQHRLGFLDSSLLVLEEVDDAIALAAAIRDLKHERQRTGRAASELEASLDALNDELTSAQQAFAALSDAEVSLPAGGVVWEVFAEPGAAVTAGEPLFSYALCDRRMAQATVDDSTVELLRQDHPVTVYLYGEGTPIAGQVKAVYGSGAHIARSRLLAANVQEVGITDAIVLIEIGPASEPAQRRRLCDIGRTAYVEFEGIGFLDPFINRLF